MPNTALAVKVPLSPEPSKSAGTIEKEQGGRMTAANPDGITPEIMTVIEAAVKAYAGKQARIVSVRMVPESQETSSSWVNDGLSLVHGSHNLVQHGH